MSFENVPHAPKTPIIRGLLHNFPDGLTVSEICTKTFIDSRVVRTCLKKMADCYIDRWMLGKHQKPPEAVWCVANVPENCPKPNNRKTKE
jgi:hypothetical protein